VANSRRRKQKAVQGGKVRVEQKKTQKRSAGSLSLKLALVVLGLVLVAMLELGVRMLPLDNLWRPTDDPFVGFSEVHPVFVPGEVKDGRSMMVTAENKLRWFNPQQFPSRKEPGVLRIFTLGGSTTYGRPYADETSFAGWLRILLEKSGDQDRKYEVINAGGVSYASYRVVNVLKELLDYEPDMFVVYTGHNEFLEARTYEDFYEEQGSFGTGVRKKLEGLETYRLLDRFYRKVKGPEPEANSSEQPRNNAARLSAEVETILDRSAGLDLYHRDSTFSNGVFEHFDFNIALIKQLCGEAGVPILFLEPVDNLKDFSPFKSEESARLDIESRKRLRETLAEGLNLLARGQANTGLSRLRSAVAMDSLFALSHYFLGGALLETGDTTEAAKSFHNARELDVCPLRAQRPIHDILLKHTVGKDDPDLMPLPMLFASVSPGGLIGQETLIDHIHPYPQGHLWIALEVLGWMRDEGMVRADYKPSTEDVELVFNDAMSVLPEEYFQKGLLNLTKVLLWARKYQEALQVMQSQWEILQNVAQARYLVGTIMEHLGDTQSALEHLRKALELEEDHLMVLGMLARVYTRIGMADSAKATYVKVLGYKPDDPGILSDYGVMLSMSGEGEQALQVFEKARRLSPDMVGLGNNIGLIHYLDGRNEQAMQEFRQEIELNPADAQAYYNVGTVYARSDSLGQAEKYYLEALARQPEHVGARMNLGNIYQQKGNLAEAEQQFQIAITSDPNQLGPYINLANLYKQGGRLDEAEAVVKAGLALFPGEQQLIRLIQD
jgi:tetratricopeptide (TPR) repeat protein